MICNGHPDPEKEWSEGMAALQKGTVKTWKDREGYGFIQPAGGGEDVFFHARTVLGRRRPRMGDRARFRTKKEKGKTVAFDVHISGLAAITWVTIFLVLAGIAAVVIAFMDAATVPWPVLAYTVMSLITFVFYAVDKSRARRNKWRISEITLHGLEAAGGWPGAVLAQQFFRHKRQKGSYLVVFWFIVMAHIGFWVWWFLGR